MSFEEEQGYERDTDDEAHPSGPLVKSSKTGPINKFSYIIESIKKFQLSEEEVRNQKAIKDQAKADAVHTERHKGKNFLFKALGQETVEEFYKRKIVYDRYCLRAHEYKSSREDHSVNFDDHLVGTVLNELMLGMILFNDPHTKDFISVNDFDDMKDESLYNVQETFPRFHDGPCVDDLTRTFSSLLIVEVDKRNMNPDIVQHLTLSEFFEDQRCINFSSCSVSASKDQDPKERVLVQRGWQCHAERCRFPLEVEQRVLLLEVYKAGKLCFILKGIKQISMGMTSFKVSKKV
ncbi:hypothetical protein Tco_0731479 [Tanacetum coccineum]